MKTKIQKTIGALVLLALFTFNLQLSTCFAQGTAFTYQGRLMDGGSPANGSYDLTFSLFDADTNGNLIAGPLTNAATTVSNGLFTTTLDFGNQFSGAARWLQIGVRTNGDTGAFTILNPRQPLTPTPYAIMANNSSNLLGKLPTAQLSGTIQNSSLPSNPSFSGTVTANSLAGNGASIAGVNAAALNGKNATNFWQLGGNNVAGGQFLGSTNNQPVELWVNGSRALRLEPGFGVHGRAPNVIGGASQNFVAANIQGATIGGGGAESFYGGPATNSVTADYGTVAGGFNNTSSGNQATVSGGHVNVASADSATVGGGYKNVASGAVSVVPGGKYNQAAGTGSFAAGEHAQALHQGSFVWGDSQNADFSSTANNQFLIRAQNGVGINTTRPAGALSINTGAGTLTVRNEAGLTPGIDITNGYFGTLRLRNALEVWPSDDRSQAGRLDVRDTNGNPQISLQGASGNVSASGKVRAASFSGNGALPWQVVSGTSVQAAPNTAYLLTNRSTQVTVTLPASPKVGDLVSIASPNGWKISQNAGQSILTSLMGLAGWQKRALRTPKGDFAGEPWTCVTVSSDGSKMAAGFTGGPIYTSSDYGETWAPSAGSPSTNWQAIACSSDGSKLVAAVNVGHIYTSTDSGVSWTASASAPVTNWMSVASSADGTKLVAADMVGQVYTSTDSGTSWSQVTAGLPTSGLDVYPSSSALASSADGTKLAIADAGQIYISENSGASWSSANLSATADLCSCSADGSRLVAVSSKGTIWTSSDSGTTWTTNKTYYLAVDWTGVAESSDGSKVLLISNPHLNPNVPGTGYESSDSGTTWAAIGPSGFNADVALSADGTIQVVANGALQTDDIYVRQETSSVGTSGFVTGTGNSAIKLIYTGNGQWLPLSYGGQLSVQ